MKFIHFILKTVFRSLIGSKSRIFGIWGMRRFFWGSRLERVEPEDAWKMFLMDILSHRPHLLSPESDTAVRSFLEKAVQ